MSPATVEKHLGRMRFMRGAFDRIHWRFVDIDSRMFMPVTREKVEGWFEEHVRVDAGGIDRLVFDVVSCIMRAIGDFVLFRRILRELGRIFYRNGTAAILIEDAGEYGLPATVGMSECALQLDIIRTPTGYRRAMRILKRYGVEHTLNWIPFEITPDGIRLDDREYFELDTSLASV